MEWYSRFAPDSIPEGNGAFADMERMSAGTIHAFCTHLLRERPVEAGVTPKFTELHEVQDTILRGQSWRDSLERARADGSPVPRELDAAAPAAENANDLFQQALVKERTEGNLPEAIKLYQRIVDKYGSNHMVAAQALLQLAGYQSKLGDAQARKSLERLARDFADQKETVAEARARLAAFRKRYRLISEAILPAPHNAPHWLSARRARGVPHPTRPASGCRRASARPPL